MIINIMILLILLTIVPFIVGMLYTSFLPEERSGIILSWSAGHIILWGLFEIIALPLIFLRKSLGLLLILYAAIVLLIMIAALIKSWSQIIPMLQKGIDFIKHISLIGWGNVLLIAGQAFVYIKYMHIDDDDAFYVGAASTAVSTNTIFSIDPYTGTEYAKLPARYVLSPFFSFVAVLSKISGIHPAIITHVILAGVLIVLSCAVYFLVGKKLFPDNLRSAEYFLFFAMIITLFSGYSIYTQGTFSLVRIWQGKGMFCAVLVPMLCNMMLQLFSKNTVAADWWFMFLLMSACCMASSMGIMLGAIMVGIFGILIFLKNRDIKALLYTILCCLPNIVCAGAYLIIR